MKCRSTWVTFLSFCSLALISATVRLFCCVSVAVEESDMQDAGRAVAPRLFSVEALLGLGHKEEEENLFGQNSESRYENKYPKKEFQYDDIHTPNGRNGSGHYDLDSEEGDSFKFSTGHLSSFKYEKEDTIDVPEQSEKKRNIISKTR